ncbi:MAG: DUF4143 domain-containing protein [Paracoccaceae bacterium]
MAPQFHPHLSGIGESWEGLVIENVVSALPSGVHPYFYRTSAGAEIDLLLDFGQETWAIGIRKTTAPKLPKGFHIACEDLKPARKYVVYGGDEAFGLTRDITAIPLLALMDEISELEKKGGRPYAISAEKSRATLGLCISCPPF